MEKILEIQITLYATINLGINLAPIPLIFRLYLLKFEPFLSILMRKRIILTSMTWTWKETSYWHDDDDDDGLMRGKLKAIYENELWGFLWH